MPSQLPQFRIPAELKLLKKLRYVAEYNARSANREVEMLIRQHVNSFEDEHGEITFPE